VIPLRGDVSRERIDAAVVFIAGLMRQFEALIQQGVMEDVTIGFKLKPASPEPADLAFSIFLLSDPEPVNMDISTLDS
jgi:hypothetical protein